MKKREGQHETHTAERSPEGGGRKSWEEPKLAFVEPKLTGHGKLEKITRGRKHDGFFGQFSP